MAVIVAVVLALLFAGVLVVLAGYFVKRRMDRWADAMIASFDLWRIADGCGQDSLREELRRADRATIHSVMSRLDSIRHWVLSRVRLLRLRRAVT